MVTTLNLFRRLPIAFVLVGGIAMANTINVPGDYPTIQAAIDAAQSGDVVVVAPGTYVEAINFRGKAITVESSSGSDVTTIDAAATGSVVRFVTGETRASVLQGFTLTGGTGSLSGAYGGGIYCNGTSPTILDNDVVNNNVNNEGGGIFLNKSGALIQGNTIRQNSAVNDGGGITSLSAAGLEITSNLIEENTSYAGAGASILSSSSATLDSNEVARNVGDYGAGVSADDGALVRNNWIHDNTAAYEGGGIYAAGNSTYEANTIENNIATGDSEYLAGGGISVVSTTGCWIERNVIRGNQATYWAIPYAYGGGIYVADHATLVGNLIVDNDVSAIGDDGGGGVVLGWRPSTLTNNTIANNQATNYGGIEGNGGGDVITNCIVRGNVGKQIFDFLGVPQVTYSDVEGGWNGTGNIDADALFVDPSNGDYHLTGDSPCIEAGSNAAPDLPATDLDGDPRIFGATVDLGSDEYVGGPMIHSISPNRTKYDQSLSVTIGGHLFSVHPGVQVLFGSSPASNVVVVDDQTITCDAPASEPGPADVVVSNDLGAGTLPQGFIYTPATQIVGTPLVGSTVTIRYHVDPGDEILALYGVPPLQSVPTPPYVGELCIVPFHVFFVVPGWPLDVFSIDVDIPNDPALSGVQVLLQALVGPSLATPPKDGVWTNCATLAIQ